MEYYILKSSIDENFEKKIKKSLLEKYTDYVNAKKNFSDNNIIELPFEPREITIFIDRLKKDTPILLNFADTIDIFINYCFISDYLCFDNNKIATEIKGYLLKKKFRIEISTADFLYFIKSFMNFPSTSFCSIAELINVFFSIYYLQYDDHINFIKKLIEKKEKYLSNENVVNILGNYLAHYIYDKSFLQIISLIPENFINNEIVKLIDKWITYKFESDYDDDTIFDIIEEILNEKYMIQIVLERFKYYYENKANYSQLVYQVIGTVIDKGILHYIKKIASTQIIHDIIDYTRIECILHKITNSKRIEKLKLSLTQIDLNDNNKIYVINKNELKNGPMYLSFLIDQVAPSQKLSFIPVKIYYNNEDDKIYVNYIGITYYENDNGIPIGIAGTFKPRIFNGRYSNYCLENNLSIFDDDQIEICAKNIYNNDDDE